MIPRCPFQPPPVCASVKKKKKIRHNQECQECRFKELIQSPGARTEFVLVTTSSSTSSKTQSQLSSSPEQQEVSACLRLWSIRFSHNSAEFSGLSNTQERQVAAAAAYVWMFTRLVKSDKLQMYIKGF